MRWLAGSYSQVVARIVTSFSPLVIKAHEVSRSSLYS